MTEECISLWEINWHTPRIDFMPKIIQFLGYSPIPINTTTLSGQIYAYRLYNGLSYAAMGKLVGVDTTTIAGWEREEHQPVGDRLKRLQQLLQAISVRDKSSFPKQHGKELFIFLPFRHYTL